MVLSHNSVLWEAACLCSQTLRNRNIKSLECQSWHSKWRSKLSGVIWLVPGIAILLAYVNSWAGWHVWILQNYWVVRGYLILLWEVIRVYIWLYRFEEWLESSITVPPYVKRRSITQTWRRFFVMFHTVAYCTFCSLITWLRLGQVLSENKYSYSVAYLIQIWLGI